MIDQEKKCKSMNPEVKKSFECTLCRKSYVEKYGLTVHMRTHDSERKFKCNLCPKSFNYKNVLRDHLHQVHSFTESGEKLASFDCPHCEYKSKRSQDLKKHISARHEGNSQVYPCNICEKIFKGKGNLKRHISIVHLLQREYVCVHCGQLFSQSSNLKLHQKIHDKTRKCVVCGEVFGSGQLLSVHLLTHVPKVGHNCPFCSYVLASESDARLKRHIREKHRQ